MQPINHATITSDVLRPTQVEVRLSRLAENLRAIQQKVAPARVMPILKANAYGHGMVEVARFLETCSVEYLGVAYLEEGILLRQQAITTPILVLGGIIGNQVPLFLQNNLTLTASSIEKLEQIESAAEQMGVSAKVHLKIDTGMERIGVHYYSAENLLEASLKCRRVQVEGIFSHFANADALDLAHARLQLERFNEVLRFYERRSLPTPLRHMANSAGVLQLPESTFDLVRPGILLYGVYPSKETVHTVAVQPALAWKSRVVYFKVVQPGHPVSYGSTWESDHPVRMVTIPVGYGDGYFRSLSNKAQVIIRGQKYPQVGRVCMDQMMVNIEMGTAYNDDEVVLLGESEGQAITAEDLADWAGTIPYEILTNINTRVSESVPAMTMITLTTDFGLKDGNVGVMKGVILGIAPRTQIVDISHFIPPQNVREAALILLRSAPYFPPKTIHLAVVNPGVGTARRPIAARLGTQWFVGPDNGILTMLLEYAEQRRWPTEFVYLDKPQFWLPEISYVFHGRDIFAPVAAHLANGKALQAVGTPIDDPTRLILPKPHRLASGWEGEVIHIDHFGNVASNIRVEHLAERIADPQKIIVHLRGATIHGLVRTFGDRPTGELVALFGSTGNLIVSVVNGNAAQTLGVKAGDPLQVVWES